MNESVVFAATRPTFVLTRTLAFCVSLSKAVVTQALRLHHLEFVFYDEIVEGLTCLDSMILSATKA